MIRLPGLERELAGSAQGVCCRVEGSYCKGQEWSSCRRRVEDMSVNEIVAEYNMCFGSGFGQGTFVVGVAKKQGIGPGIESK